MMIKFKAGSLVRNKLDKVDPYKVYRVLYLHKDNYWYGNSSFMYTCYDRTDSSKLYDFMERNLCAVHFIFLRNEEIDTEFDNYIFTPISEIEGVV